MTEFPATIKSERQILKSTKTCKPRQCMLAMTDTKVNSVCFDGTVRISQLYNRKTALAY